MSTTAPTKDPDALLDYTLDWTDWLGTDDVITTSVWIVPVGLVLEASTHTGRAATAWLSGGTVDERYTVTNRITTTGGRIDDRSFTINVRNR